MPLFGHKKEVAPPEPEARRSSGLFKKHQEVEPVQAEPRRSGTLFNRRRSSSPSISSSRHTSNSSHSPSTSRNFLSRHHGDPSITAARERVLSAEAAEQEADRALVQARHAVKEAREHVKRLEKEAAEEARLAQIKQREAASISKRAKPLGRHDRI